MVLDFITNPNAFFARRADEPRFLGPLAVVFLVGVVSAVAAFPAVKATLSALPPEAQAFGGIAVVFAVIAAFVFSVIRWVLYSLAFAVVSRVAFDPEGDFSSTFALTGWGFAPYILSGIVSAYAAFAVFGNVTVPTDLQLIGPFIAELQRDPLFVVAGLVGIVSLLWSGLLWSFAVHHARNLGLRDAGITVAVPLAVELLLQVNGLVGAV